MLGLVSRFAARASMAAARQGKYLVFHVVMMGAPGGLTEDAAIAIAGRVRLDVARLRRDMADPAIEVYLDETHRLAEALGITGTPVFVIGDTLVPGAVGGARLKELIAEARSGGRLSRRACRASNSRAPPAPSPRRDRPAAETFPLRALSRSRSAAEPHAESCIGCLSSRKRVIQRDCIRERKVGSSLTVFRDVVSAVRNRGWRLSRCPRRFRAHQLSSKAFLTPLATRAASPRACFSFATATRAASSFHRARTAPRR